MGEHKKLDKNQFLEVALKIKYPFYYVDWPGVLFEESCDSFFTGNQLKAVGFTFNLMNSPVVKVYIMNKVSVRLI